MSNTLQEQCKQLLPLIQAGAEGRILQNSRGFVVSELFDSPFYTEGSGWSDTEDIKIKPEPKCVPWESIDEIPEEALNGWWKRPASDACQRILKIDIVYNVIRFETDQEYLYLCEVFNQYNWSPTAKNPVWHIAGKEVV